MVFLASCKLIMKKPEIVYSTSESNVTEDYRASRGWLCRFMKRNGLSKRKKTTVDQQDTDRLVAKLVSYVIQIRRLQIEHKCGPSDIIAMDETPVWCDMILETNVDATGKKSVTLKTTGHEKARISVVLFDKAYETKLEP